MDFTDEQSLRDYLELIRVGYGRYAPQLWANDVRSSDELAHGSSEALRAAGVANALHADHIKAKAALGRALACVGRVHAVPQGAGADCVAADNAVGSCVLVRESDGAAATTLHVWEAATEHGHEAWVSLANGAPPIPVRLERSSVDSDVALMAPIRRLALQLPAAVTLGTGCVGDPVWLYAYPQVVDKEMPSTPLDLPCRFPGHIASVHGNESVADYVSFGNCSGGAVFGARAGDLMGLHVGTISPHEDASDWGEVNEQLKLKTEAPIFVSSAQVARLLLPAKPLAVAARTVERERSRRRRQRAAAQRRRWRQGGVFSALLWPIISFCRWLMGD